MKLSQYFLPTLKENPIDATVVSHQLMIRSGMIRQTASGIYSWLPLGLKVLRNVEKIIKDEMNKIGCLEVLMPTIQPAELWMESGRYEAYGKEMLRIKDRHERDILYGPTHEEVVTDIFRKNVTSYKDLPKNLYQIHWKFRDEIRPRFGVMRGREFLMKDGYSFDIDEAAARKTYDSIYEAYFRIFQKMGLKPIALRADTGAIGGDLSHEFHILADSGESAIFYDKKFDEISESKNFDIKQMQEIYAMADEMHDPQKCPISAAQLVSRRGIEVGHIFNFGQKYSKVMNASVMGANGEKIYPNMGSYGIGVSRVVAAAIEANHDAAGIIWPKEIAPFQVAIIPITRSGKSSPLSRGDVARSSQGDELRGEGDVSLLCEEIYQKFLARGVEVIYDDTKSSLGQKFATMDLIGIPTQIIVGPKSAAAGMVEVKDRKSGERREIEIGKVFEGHF